MKNSIKDDKGEVCCHLKKQVNKAGGEDQNKSGPDSNEDVDTLYYDLPITFQLREVRHYSFQILLNAGKNSLRLLTFTVGVFRPPNTVG